MTKLRLFVAFAGLIVLGADSVAQPPARDISRVRHPNLAAAQRLSRQAYERITTAQEVNEWDMEGHAKRAKELLERVNNELKLAAEAANKNPR
jgi:hypothetical protein